MSTATTIRNYLKQHHVECDAMHHPHTATALESAMVANVDADCVAKAVMVGDELGLMMAVVPASHQLKIKRLRQTTGRNLHLLTERELRDRRHSRHRPGLRHGNGVGRLPGRARRRVFRSR